MAEIDQPRARSAVASTSSPPVNMGAAPSDAEAVTPRASGGAHPQWWTSGHQGVQGWGTSMSRSAGLSMSGVIRITSNIGIAERERPRWPRAQLRGVDLAMLFEAKASGGGCIRAAKASDGRSE